MRLADVNLDVGRRTTSGMYKTADKAYEKLVAKYAEHGFVGMPEELRNDILNFFQNGAALTASGDKTRKLRQQLEMLRSTAAYSRP